MKTSLNDKLAEVLKENVDNFSQQEIMENDSIIIAEGIESQDGEVVDIHFNPSKKEVMELKTKNGESCCNFVPLAEFKPEVYGLSSDVFDQVESSNSIQNSTQQVSGMEVSEIEITDQEETNDFDPAYEENSGFKKGRNLAAIEDEPSDVTPEDFNDIEDDILLEYAYSKNVDFTTRKRTIQTLFEHNKVSKKELEALKTFIKKQKLNEEVSLLQEDNFLAKFGSDLDFRNIDANNEIGTEEQSIYTALNDMSQEDWEEYQNELMSTGVTVSYDPIRDVFEFKSQYDDSEEEEVSLLEEDEFLAKFGSDLDFRNIDANNEIGTEEQSIYTALNDMSQEDWEEYQNELMSTGVIVSYDPIRDVFEFKSQYDDSEEEEELYEVESEDKQIIENIIKPSSYILKEVKGMPKSTGKSHLLNIVVEKDNYQTTIVYNDKKNIKPWSIEGKEFNTLTESLNNIYIPFKHLVKETMEANSKVIKRKTLLEEIRKDSWNKTKNLPLAEKEIRTNRSIDLIKSMFKESVNNEETDSYLEELKKIDEKYDA